jgi:hypothetical protein
MLLDLFIAFVLLGFVLLRFPPFEIIFSMRYGLPFGSSDALPQRGFQQTYPDSSGEFTFPISIVFYLNVTDTAETARGTLLGINPNSNHLHNTARN